MIPKLTDFSRHELQMAKELFHIHKNEIFVYLYSNVSKSHIKYSEYDYQMACQWYTKLTEALQEVERQERIQSN